MSKIIDELKLDLSNLYNDYYDESDELLLIRNKYDEKKKSVDTIKQEIRSIEDQLIELGEGVETDLI